MSVTRTTKGAVAARVWDLQASRELAQFVTALIVTRVFRRGLDTADRRFRPYSTRGPLYVTRGRGTGARLSPKGGKPSKSGRSVRYDGGYREFKQSSRGTDFVDLTLSGQLLRSIRPTSIRVGSVTVGMTGQALVYGMHIQRQGRVFMGLSPSDKRKMDGKIGRLIKAAMARSRGRR